MRKRIAAIEPQRHGLNVMRVSLRKLSLVAASLALVVGLATTIRLAFQHAGFNEDDFFQLAFINEAFPHFFVQFVRLDQHPPFHFLQLKVWALVSDSDSWLLANSVVWHLVSCLTIFLVGRAWLGTPAACLAVAMFALTPQVVTASTSLRMYAMIPALAVGLWWAQVRVIEGRWKGTCAWLAMAGLELALAYAHAIAFYFVFWIVVAGVAHAWSTGVPINRWRVWLAAQGVLGVLMLPLPILAVARAGMGGAGADSGNADPGTVMEHWGGMVAGWGIQPDWALALGFAFFAAALAGALANRATKTVGILLLVAPYTVAAIVSLLFAPMFKTPVYSAMLVPFACLCLAGFIMSLSPVRSVVASGVMLSAMLFAVTPAVQQLTDRVSPYEELSQYLNATVKAGDVVVIPKPYLYWAIMRYSVGPRWGSTLEVLPPPNEKWLRLFSRIGEDRSRALKLYPKTNEILKDGVRYVIGEPTQLPEKDVANVWLVQRNRDAMELSLGAGFLSRGVVFQLGRPESGQIIRYERALIVP